MGGRSIRGSRLLALAMGAVTLRTGWVLPTARSHVTKPALYGFGLLCLGASLAL